jgi:hypothetical protein
MLEDNFAFDLLWLETIWIGGIDVRDTIDGDE